METTIRAPRLLLLLYIALSAAHGFLPAYNPSSRQLQSTPRAAIYPIKRSDDNSLLEHKIPPVVPPLPGEAPTDPWTFRGPKGLYVLSKYRDPSLRLSWLATFIITCLGDIVDSISNQGFQGDEPYPGGSYTCELDYPFPSGPTGRFKLQLERMAVPGWHMTFSDIADDLEALYYAGLWFDDKPGKVPQMNLEIYRFRTGRTGPTFLASRGSLFLDQSLNSNVTLS